MANELIAVVGTLGGAILAFFGTRLTARSTAKATIDAAVATGSAQYAATLAQLNHKERLAAYCALFEESQVLIDDLEKFARLDTVPGPEGTDVFESRAAVVRSAASRILFHGPSYVYRHARLVELGAGAVSYSIKPDFPVYSGWRALTVASNEVHGSSVTADCAREARSSLDRIKRFTELAADLTDGAELPSYQRRLQEQALANARQALAEAQLAGIVNSVQVDNLLIDAEASAHSPDSQLRYEVVQPFKETLDEFISVARHELDDLRLP